MYQASNHYHSTQDSVIAWKIGNEPPAKTFQGISEADYIKFVDVACQVVRATDPNALVVLGAPEHGSGVQAVQHQENWYYRVLEMLNTPQYTETASCLTALGAHAYGGARHAEYLAVGLNDLWTYFGGQTSLPIWMTETGVAHAGQTWCGQENKPPCASEEETANYLIQNYVWALQGAAKRGYRGKVFHHHFRDTFSPDPRDGPWGLLHVDTSPYPAYYAAKLMVEKLNGAEWYADESQEGYFHRIVFRGQNGEFINVVWAVQRGDPVPGSAGVLLAHDGMSAATIYEITGPTEPIAWTLEALSNESGILYYPLEFPAATAESDPGIGSPYPMIGGHTYILIESSDATNPLGSASLVWETNQCIVCPTGTYLWSYDGESGLDRVTVECSPAAAYDLSTTEPRRTYAGIVESVPPEGSTCTLTLYDRAGNSTQQELYNPGCFTIPGCGGGPGGDHPDDNYSAAGGEPWPEGEFLPLPDGARVPPRVAILNRGLGLNPLRLLFDLGEPAVLVEEDFDPVATVEQYPVLLIPSGGLYGLENSASFRAANQRISESANHHQRPPHRDPVSLHGYTLRRRYARFVIYHLLICHSSHLPDLRHRLT